MMMSAKSESTQQYSITNPHASSADSVKMMDACSSGDISAVRSLFAVAVAEDEDTSNNLQGNNQLSRAQLLAAQQDQKTGLSPLMVASQYGHLEICQALLDAGAPWNAVDRHGKCAGDYATDMHHWDVVNLLVDVGTKAEVC